MPDAKTVTIYHDAFGRWSLVRQVERGGSCRWCGQPARFRYGIKDDARPYRPAWDNHTFCSVGCRRTYYS